MVHTVGTYQQYVTYEEDVMMSRRPGPDPDSTAAALVRRWHQHFAVAIDGPLERAASGSERLPEIVDAWLDLARRTAPVRAQVARFGGPRTAAEQARQEALLLGLLREDLALIGVPAPHAAATALLAEMTRIVAAEDRAGRPLRAQRVAALRAAGLGPAAPPARVRLATLLGGALLRSRRAVPVG
jgi:hypothetical protein